MKKYIYINKLYKLWEKDFKIIRLNILILKNI